MPGGRPKPCAPAVPAALRLPPALRLFPAGLSFAPTEGGSANEEAVLASLALALPTGSLSPAAWWTAANYLYDRYDKTIPNAAYDYGAQLAGKRGWTAGETGAGADWWNLFK